MKTSRVLRCVCALAAVAGCGGGGSPAAPLVPTSIVIAPPVSAALAGGATLQLVVTVKDQKGGVIAGQSVSWLSSDPTRATVTPGGMVTGLLVGTVSITAVLGSLTSTPVSLTIVSGPASAIARQRNVAGQLTVGTSDSLAVRITDGGGNPVAGTSVAFAVTLGGGSFAVPAAVSGNDGVAGVRWTLGTIAGTQAATATALLAGASTAIVFGTTATAGATAAITKVGAEPPAVPALSNVDSIRVAVTDQFGNPKAGETVTFAVTAGGGSVSPASVTTGVDGLAAARWTVGAAANTLNAATATRAGLATSPVTFNVTTTQALVASVVVAGARLVVLDSGTSMAVALVARDVAGDSLAGVLFALTSRSPAITVSNGSVTGALRGTTFVVGSSVQTPNARDSILVTVAIPGAPVVITDLARVDIKTDTTFTVGLTVDMRASGAKLGATTIQLTWDPTVMAYVSDADGAAGAGAGEVVNTANTSSGSLTMSMASATGFSGAVQLRKFTFKAASAAGQTGRLSLFVSELTSASTFISFLSSTVAAIYPLITR
jgi:hypothetical protein